MNKKVDIQYTSNKIDSQTGEPYRWRTLGWDEEAAKRHIEIVNAGKMVGPWGKLWSDDGSDIRAEIIREGDDPELEKFLREIRESKKAQGGEPVPFLIRERKTKKKGKK